MYQWLRDVDAGDLVLVIDACHAAAVTGKEFKPGPMGSRGMGQLAYDKGMRILAATQPDTTAAEVDDLNQKRKIQHGLLTYALVQDGLVNHLADNNKDKVILLPEWLEYGVTGVPKLYDEAAKSQKASADQASAPGWQRGANKVRFISRGEGDTSTQQPSLQIAPFFAVITPASKLLSASRIQPLLHQIMGSEISRCQQEKLQTQINLYIFTGHGYPLAHI